MRQRLTEMIYPAGVVIIILLISGLVRLMHQQIIPALPVGLSALIAILVIVPIFLRVLKQRLENSEDDYYSNNVNQ
ncbi:hypothetical protein ACFL6E_07250 [Candidatus Neomarinimicrobiota bacterium]